ncbi:MAG: hypothetical protein HY863_18460 [Chloroflexi bacterium]|nr:hypothetical protein [Chloroflexota bacterium]
MKPLTNVLQKIIRFFLTSILLIGILITRPAYAATIQIPPGNVADLIAAINTANDESANPGPDIISLAPNSIYTLTTLYDWYGGLPSITSQITINGNGSTIQRDSTTTPFRIFLVDGTGDLTINGLTISNGGRADGGGIYNQFGKLQVNDSIFSNNDAPEYGSAINNVVGIVTITNSTFFGNTGNYSVTSRDGGQVDISNSNFSNNPGGDVYSAGSTINISNSTFSGGNITSALFNRGTMTVADSSISGYTSTSLYGGGIHNQGILSVIRTTINNNNSDRPDGIDAGGGIFNSDGRLTISDSIITNNISGRLGGGVFSQGFSAEVNISNSVISNNSASSGGGGIFYGGGNWELSIVNTEISNNSVISGVGGGILAAGIVSITGSTISGNTASNTGGAFFFENINSINANNNCIVGNSSVSAFNTSSSSINATNNWWGASNGPSGVASGTGDSVSSNVDYAPYLTNAPTGCSTLPTATPTNTPPPLPTDTPTPSNAIVYDAFADFSPILNPPPGSTWMYGYTWTLGGAFDLYRALRNDIDRPLSVLWTRPENFITPNVNKNISGVDIINVDGCILHPPTVYLNLHPGQNNEFSVLRWTAPENGTYVIDSAFKSLRFCSQPTTTDGHILYNSTPIFNVFINEYMSVGDHAFSTTLDLNTGDTIDFVVGVGQNGNYGADSTGVRATITKISGGSATPTPTPTSSPIPPPTASAGGPYYGTEGSAIALSGASASTPNINWSVDSLLCSFSNVTALNPNLTCSDNGNYTVTLTVNDGVNPPVSNNAVVTVNNVAPLASLGNSGPINEGDSVTVSFSGQSDPSNVDTLAGFHYAFDCSGGSLSAATYEGSQASDSTSCTFADNGNYVVSGKIIDKDGGSNEYTTTVTVNNVAPTLSAITIGQALIPVNTPISASAFFTDPGTLDTHMTVWNWDDTTTSSGSISSASGSGTASASHSYSLPGVYLVKLTVTDKDGAPSNQSIYEFVVVYDPTAGFVTGSGSINSPAGAYLANPSATGQGKFGFNTKYKKNGELESETAFELEAGSFHFYSSSAQWLAVTGAKATFQGIGSVEGSNHHFGFTVTVIDGQFTSSSLDMFRLRIWDIDNGNDVVYDNERGSYIYADPTTQISKGNIKIKK